MHQELHFPHLVRLPLPLAQLYSRAILAPEIRSQHNNAFYLFEALVKLMAAPAVAAYLQSVRQGGPRVPTIDRQIGHLARPSLGTFVDVVWELAKFFEGPDHPLGRLRKQLQTQRGDLRAVTKLDCRIKDGPDGETTNQSRCSLLQLIKDLVRYRNKVLGHGGDRSTPFYQMMFPLLLGAANEVLAEGVLDVLGPPGTRLVYVASKQFTSGGQVELGLRELVGLEGWPAASLLLDPQDVSAVAPNQVAVLWPGQTVPLSLAPLLIFREDELAPAVLMLNEGPEGKPVEYLDYRSGRTESHLSTVRDLAALLTLATDRGVGESQSQDPAVNVLDSATAGPSPIPTASGQELSKRLFVTTEFNVPYPQNPYFVEPKRLLRNLRSAFTRARKPRRIQILNGLGGVGKTQTALEYAYRYRNDYRLVCWIRATTKMDLTAGCCEMVRQLQLPQKDINDTDEMIRVFKDWLNHNTSWLLIFDDVSQPELLAPFCPANPHGHILITSRARVFHQLKGATQPIELIKMAPEDSLRFLFERTGRDQTDAEEVSAARKLTAELLDGLPLALEQAGAYLVVHPMPFQAYLKSYETRGFDLLGASPPVVGDYPASVATTWALNFDEVERESIAAADLLRLSAFFNPNRIPFDLFTKARSRLSPAVQEALAGVDDDPVIMYELLEPLRKYSLIRPEVDGRTYSIHRLVQEVVRHRTRADGHLWAQRAVQVVSRVFPDPTAFGHWTACDLLLPHALTVSRFAQGFGLELPDLIQLLSHAAKYLYERGQYSEAEPLYLTAIDIRERLKGEEDSDSAQSLNDLGGLYYAQGRYQEAEKTFLQALAIRERLRPEDPLVIAQSLNDLAGLYFAQARYKEAEPLFERAVAMRENALGPDHPDLAQGLHNLAGLYYVQARYKEAEPLFERALNVRESNLSADHPDLAQSLNGLAGLYFAQARYEEAERLFTRALTIREGAFGRDHPDVAQSLNDLAGVYYSQGRYEETERLFKRALAIRERVGANHPDVALTLNNLGELYLVLRRYDDAERCHLRAQSIWSKTQVPNHPNLSLALRNLARVRSRQHRYAEAERLHERALKLLETCHAPDHPTVAECLVQQGELFNELYEYDRAEPLLTRALAIWDRRQEHGVDSEVRILTEKARILTSLSRVYAGKHLRATTEEPFNRTAEEQLKQAVEMITRAHGPHHVAVAQALYNLAEHCNSRGATADAASAYNHALVIWENATGVQTGFLAQVMDKAAMLYRILGQYRTAENWYSKALALRESALGKDDPEVGESLGKLAQLAEIEGKSEEANRLRERSLELKLNQFASPQDKVMYLTLLARSEHRRGLAAERTAEDHKARSAYQRAQGLYQRAVDVWEGRPDDDPEKVAFCLNNLALIHHQQGLYFDGRGEHTKAVNEYDQSEVFYRRALKLWEATLDRDNPTLGIVVNSLATLCLDQGRHSEAQRLYERALAIWNSSLLPTDPNVAFGLNALAEIYHTQSRYADAKGLYEEALSIWRSLALPDDINLRRCEKSYQLLLDTLPEAASQVRAPVSRTAARVTPALSDSPALERTGKGDGRVY